MEKQLAKWSWHSYLARVERRRKVSKKSLRRGVVERLAQRVRSVLLRQRGKVHWTVEKQSEGRVRPFH